MCCTTKAPETEELEDQETQMKKNYFEVRCLKVIADSKVNTRGIMKLTLQKRKRKKKKGHWFYPLFPLFKMYVIRRYFSQLD